MNKRGLSIRLSDIESVRKNWGWFFVLGMTLLLLGMTVIGSAATATLFSVVLFGFFLIGASVVQIIHTFMTRKWSGFFLSLLLSILYAIMGVFFLAHPVASAMEITLVVAVFCFIGGLFKMIAPLVLRFEAWGWVFFNGLVTFVLGCLIYSQWPMSALWLIGTFIGVDMILAGWSWILLALQAKKT